ncbi:AI-2E family transporter [Citreimonas salinaria]|uniref:Predicted PurR-regulated permease PerM n=1 Tax=Citreimonas salinaria TaxID=321339 RepID=A0A1H3H6W4_9RHOB|nr:AI-2E family transporter [Citreimonas salinaria]SDY11303.1 Predicted PurR-regulated permease PerM [Citreimonas salinaria]
MSDSHEPATAEPKETHAALAPCWAVVGIFLMLFVAGLAYARAFLMPVVLALLLQLVFSPLRRQMERMGLSAGLSAGIIMATLVGVLTLGAASLAVPARDWIARAPDISYELREKIEQIRGTTETVQDAAEQIDEIAEGEDEPGVQRVKVEEEGGGALSLALSLPGILAQVVFTLVLLFFLLASGDMFHEKLVHVMPTFHDKRRAIRVAYDIERKLSRYLLTITAINAGLGVAIGAAMWWLQMPNPALLGIAAFLLNFIPYLGALLGVLGSGLIAFVTLETLEQSAVVAAVYFIITSLEGQVVTPVLVGRSLRLNPVVVFLSVTLFAWLWSVVGMLVATPLLVAARTFCDHIPALHGVGHFLSARGDEGTRDETEQAGHRGHD